MRENTILSRIPMTVTRQICKQMNIATDGIKTIPRSLVLSAFPNLSVSPLSRKEYKLLNETTLHLVNLYLILVCTYHSL